VRDCISMCGIVGLYTETDKTHDELSRSIRTMSACLRHRGPDDEGHYVGRNMALGHKRLSFIDLKTDQQPILNEDNSNCIVFNGETYIYKDSCD
jgi:asparagine synthase (glutamine-hydrolysing)